MKKIWDRPLVTLAHYETPLYLARLTMDGPQNDRIL